MIQEPPPLVVSIDHADPWHAARRLAARFDGLAFLDSAMAHPQLGRWSFVAADPFGRFRVTGGTAFWNDAAEDGTPLEALRRRLALYAQGPLPCDAPFQGGAIGTFAYEAGRLFDRFPTPQPEPGEGPEIDLGFYDVVLAFDIVGRRAFLISTGWPETEPQARLARARARMAQMSAALAAPLPALDTELPAVEWTSNFDAARYEAAVARVIAYIRAGDIFQANFTQQFRAQVGAADPLAVYERLRNANPATFAALILSEGRAVASSSPERFLTLRAVAGRLEVETRPIKGTLPRSVEPTLDAFRGRELVASEKDRAENVMIVDLLRNDLSRVCRPGTVKVPRLCGLETYANVHHLVSVVTGTLKPGRDGLDLIAASFPGGSITGAPKIRAMEIIRELEGVPRGVYCGAIGYLGFDGTADLNIAIRTVTLEDGVASFGVGGGITLLSDPAAEYRESLTKAERIFRAFRQEER
ncbi:aminodeoxychorismate synthase component I [Ancylobacter defluvii]|uniref:aminodeoxychorismate synthase n=1 Tax=Ancylobacter defluvii TaxID=1282440 RepID=A0A9W6JWC4_9HYPH|nr:aminodeoxychorismate synthase component I [Ancylobacter defluvii]MBS7587773.1 aminodeoxychorismate synthase component I [Ancylobacter defluvii]GLK82583.1 aminodeoxychorismate synthase, component I [Ancylobacter defluvii]